MRNRIINRLAQDAGAFVGATQNVAEDQVQEARNRVDLALESAKGLYGQFCNKAVDGTTAVNELVHENSYQAIAIGIGVGAILGYFISRGCRNGCPVSNAGEGA